MAETKERETIINFTEEGENAAIYTCNKKIKNAMHRFGYEPTETDSHGFETFEVPKTIVQFRQVREYTDEQRQVAHDRMMERIASGEITPRKGTGKPAPAPKVVPVIPGCKVGIAVNSESTGPGKVASIKASAPFARIIEVNFKSGQTANYTIEKFNELFLTKPAAKAAAPAAKAPTAKPAAKKPAAKAVAEEEPPEELPEVETEEAEAGEDEPVEEAVEEVEEVEEVKPAVHKAPAKPAAKPVAAVKTAVKPAAAKPGVLITKLPAAPAKKTK